MYSKRTKPKLDFSFLKSGRVICRRPTFDALASQACKYVDFYLYAISFLGGKIGCEGNKPKLFELQFIGASSAGA